MNTFKAFRLAAGEPAPERQLLTLTRDELNAKISELEA